MSSGTRSALGLIRIVLLAAWATASLGLPVCALAQSFPPPAVGALSYNGFVPPLTPGAAYVDGVFGATVRRLTTDHVRDDIYARNMWWSADETRYLHRTTNGTPYADYWDVIDVATGAVTHAGIPIGLSAADGGFDPVDPDALYYYGADGIHRVTLQSSGTWTDALYWTPPGGAALESLGGTLNWLDASGRYMLVRYGPEPSVHLYDRQNLAAGPYANPIDATNYIDTGSYIGVSPDGQLLVGYDSRPGVGFGGMGQGVSWRLDHASRAIAAAPTIFWSLCGDHGSFLSASDGHNYMVVNDCYSYAGLWRVDITNNAAGLDEAQQQALPNNKLLLAYPTWSDFGHQSTVARGPLRDWAFLSTEDGTDTFNSGTADASGNITPWHAYRQEIIALNVVTGEVRRLAHHRSRSTGADYYSTPRLSASWGGAVVGFASNFNQPGSGTSVVDIYAIPFAPSAPPPVLSALTPGTVTAGAAGFVLTTSGSAFASSSVVQWNGSSRATAFVSGTQLQATIPASDIAVAGTAQVTVLNPAPGGGSSNALTLTITPAIQTLALAVVRVGNGSGTVTSSPPAIACGTACSSSFVGGTSVVLTATPGSGSSFAGWSGCDVVAGTQCTVVVTATRTVTSTFQPLDASPPVVSITAPSSGATATGTVSVSASASDNVGVVGVQFKLDGANLGPEVTAAPYAVSWNTAAAANWAHALSATARDDAGNVATSAIVTVTVSNGGTPAAQGVVWVNLVNVTATGNSLQKTSGCDGCADAGATSQQQIPAGDGYVEFTASETSALRSAGLSTGNPGTSGTEIGFAIRLQAGIAEVRESGVYRTDTTFVSGDVFRVAVESGVVKYYKNGSRFYASALAPTYPLLVDTSLNNLYATITNAVIASAVVSVTGSGDTTPPLVSAVLASSITASGAAIGWSTDEPADSRVEYGPTTAYGSATPLAPTLVTSHAQALSGLARGTVYHYRVRSRDAAGNLAVSSDFTFKTRRQ